jgi:hypothetical protein
MLNEYFKITAKPDLMLHLKYELWKVRIKRPETEDGISWAKPWIYTKRPHVQWKNRDLVGAGNMVEEMWNTPGNGQPLQKGWRMTVIQHRLQGINAGRLERNWLELALVAWTLTCTEKNKTFLHTQHYLL